MSQSRRGSLIESLASTAIGYVVAIGAQAVVLPWFGVDLPASDHAAIAAIFTAISIARGYCVRRAFNFFYN